MLFNSYEFIFAFLPVTFFIYFYLNYRGLTEVSKLFLVLSSLFFYAWWNLSYLPIILLSMLFNYSLGNVLLQMPKREKFFSKKTLLIFGIFSNISLLGYFKYTNFFIDNVNSFLSLNIALLDLALPLAISFFTFQQISYLVDVYRKEISSCNFLNYALFVSFFPQLIAGPIVHYQEMIPQFMKRHNNRIFYKNISMGIFLFSIGFFKKVVIADTFSLWVTEGFNHSSSLNFFEAWATSLSYTFQLYFDFSGYIDMAIGMALLFNIRLPRNFNSPYKALSIQDFWRRWHITLGRFLRDYIYIPLGGNRHGSMQTYGNLLMTFLLGGIWHGAGWTFLFWGLLHGLALAFHRLWSLWGLRLWVWVAWLFTFNFINLSWVFFRANSWEDAINILSAMFSFHHIVLPEKLASQLDFLVCYGINFGDWTEHIMGSKLTFIWIFLGFVLVLFFKNSTENIKNFRFNVASVCMSSFAFIWSLLSLNKVSEFLYFNF